MDMIIGQKHCTTCKFGVRKGAQIVQCHKRPPHAQAAIAMTPQGPQMLGVATVFPEFPIHDRSAFCWEHEYSPSKQIDVQMGAPAAETSPPQ